MSWPLSHEFNEAIQNPKIAFTDLDLKAGEAVVGAQGLPLPRSGNFADVYQLHGADGRDWAVKCFTRPVVGLAERYARVSEALAQANLPFAVGFSFLAEGIRVGGVWRPVVKMEWVEGLLLNQVIRENANRPAVLTALGQMWVKLCKRLREAGITHADLQHGNILLVPGSRPGSYGLKLIDYDGMYVPALANTPSGESGHPSYQHPVRATTRAYSPDVDRFPHLVVATALKGLSVGGLALWERYDNGDNLLFTEEDYKKPGESKLMRELWQTENPSLQALVGRLAIACGRPIPQTPWLDQFAPNGEPVLLDDDTRKEAAEALGIVLPIPIPLPPEPTPSPPPQIMELPPEPVAPPAPAQFAPIIAAAQLDAEKRAVFEQVGVELDITPARKKKPERKKKEQTEQTEPSEKSNGKILLLAVGGLLLFVGSVLAGIFIFGGKQKPTETVEQKLDEPKTVDPKQFDTNGGKVEEPKPKVLEPVVVPKTKDPTSVNVTPLELKTFGKVKPLASRWNSKLRQDGIVLRCSVVPTPAPASCRSAARFSYSMWRPAISFRTRRLRLVTLL
ncbi:MAG: hypothetical protein L0241_02440 [Planctomycetia bacterium]|nr:hypothetical protein [Planctomycetia bacterium]